MQNTEKIRKTTGVHDWKHHSLLHIYILDVHKEALVCGNYVLHNLGILHAHAHTYVEVLT